MKQRTAVWIFWVLFVAAVFAVVALQIVEIVSPFTGYAIMFAVFAAGTVVLGMRYPNLFERSRK